MTESAFTPAGTTPSANDGEDIPVLTDCESPGEAMIIEISRRIEARLAETLPQLVAATVREYFAEQAGQSSPRHG